MSRALILILALSCGGSALADCQLSGATITNPDDPACRDAMFRYVESASADPEEITLGYPVPLPVDSLTPVDGFRTFASLKARHQELAILLDTVTPARIGLTGYGEEILAYRLGDTDDTTTLGDREPGVLINGTIHAREWQSPEVVTGLMESLAEISADASIGQYLSENLNIVIVPILNIDGFRQTQRYANRFSADPDQPRDGRMRRKNMRYSGGLVDENIDNTGDNFQGVDLNRNNEHGYGQHGASSADPVSLVHRGPAIASEPEIQALQSAAELVPADRLRLYVDVHSFSQIYFTPLTGNARRDSLTIELMQRMRAVTGFKYRDGRSNANGVGTDAIGTTADFFAYEYQVPSWTLEIEPLNGGQDYGGTASHGHSGFILPDSEIARVREEQSQTHILGFYRQAGPPNVVAAELRRVDSDEVVYRADWSGNGTSRTLRISTNKATLPGTAYRLWVAFSKPMRWRGQDGTMQPFAGQTVDGDSGSARLEFPGSSTPPLPLAIAAADAWLADPGGAPRGYNRYRDDSLSVEFTLPADLDVRSTQAVMLVMDNRDLSNQRLDGDPTTPVSWSGGHWNGFENELGEEGDIGGRDCNISFFAASSATASPPASAPTCKVSSVPDPGNGGGGGGGAIFWLLSPLILLASRRRYSQPEG